MYTCISTISPGNKGYHVDTIPRPDYLLFAYLQNQNREPKEQLLMPQKDDERLHHAVGGAPSEPASNESDVDWPLHEGCIDLGTPLW